MLRDQLSERDEQINALKAEVREWQDYSLLKCQSPPIAAVRRRTQGQTEPSRHFNPRSARRESFDAAMKAPIAEMEARAEKLKSGLVS